MSSYFIWCYFDMTMIIQGENIIRAQVNGFWKKNASCHFNLQTLSGKWSNCKSFDFNNVLNDKLSFKKKKK